MEEEEEESEEEEEEEVYSKLTQWGGFGLVLANTEVRAREGSAVWRRGHGPFVTDRLLTNS